jgi:hypothetical protein
MVQPYFTGVFPNRTKPVCLLETKSIVKYEFNQFELLI